MARRIQLRRDTAAAWEAANPILAQGEVGVDLTNKKIKIGDGIAEWNDLTYWDDQETDLQGYATTQYVDDAIGEIVIPDVSNFITADDIPAIPQDISELTDEEGLLGQGSGEEPSQLSNSSWTVRLESNGNLEFVNPGEDILFGSINPYAVEDRIDGIKINNFTFLLNESKLIVPEGGDIVDSTGTSVLGGGSADTGNITFEETTISAPDGANIVIAGKNSDGVVNSRLDINPEYAIAKLSAKSENSRQFYAGEFGDFTSAVWEGYEAFGQQRSSITFTNASNFYNFINNDRELSASQDDESAEWSVDGENYYPWPYGWSGDGDPTLTLEFFNPEIVPQPQEPITVENFYLRWVNTSKVSVDHDDYEELEIKGVGIGVKVESTRNINMEAGDGFNLQSQNNLNLETIDGDVRIRTNAYSNTREWTFGSDGEITFPDGNIQSTAYAGSVGRALMIDTNRTDSYTEVGSADRPYKTFAAAIAAASALATAEGASEGDKRFTFILMGCTVTEAVDFSNSGLTAITISTPCRSNIEGNVLIASIPTLSQLVIRNIEIGGTFTLTGDGTSEQMNNCSFYNASFSGAVNITATNAAAFYEVAFFSPVTFTNLSYLYINGAQFNQDWTIRADDTGDYPVPSRGLNPGTGGSTGIVFGTIANNVIFVKGGDAVYVFQPHMTRMGRGAGTYTLPAGWTMTPHSSVLRGTWVNNGTVAMRNSSSDNRIKGTAPSYSGIIGGEKVIAKFTPATSKGVEGDRQGMIAADADYLYVCVADYSDGVADIWSRTAITASTW